MGSPSQPVLKVVFIPVTWCLPNLAVVWKRGWMPQVLCPTDGVGRRWHFWALCGGEWLKLCTWKPWSWCNNPARADHFLYLWIHRPRVWRLAVLGGTLADVLRQLCHSKVRWGEPRAVNPQGPTGSTNLNTDTSSEIWTEIPKGCGHGCKKYPPARVFYCHKRNVCFLEHQADILSQPTNRSLVLHFVYKLSGELLMCL